MQSARFSSLPLAGAALGLLLVGCADMNGAEGAGQDESHEMLASENGLTTINGLSTYNGLGVMNGLSTYNGLGTMNGLSSTKGLMTTTAGRTTVEYRS